MVSSSQLVRAATIETILVQEPTKPGIVPVFIVVDSSQQDTVGTDILLQYDPERIRFQNVDLTDMYPQQHAVRHDEGAHQLRFSGTHDYQNFKPAAGLFATAYFRLLDTQTEGTELWDEANPPLWLVWSANDTTDTNIVSASGEDLLVSSPPPTRIDPEFGRDQVLGAFSDVQQALLNQYGIVAEATSVQPIDWRLITIGIVSAVISVLLLVVLVRRSRKQQPSVNDSQN